MACELINVDLGDFLAGGRCVFHSDPGCLNAFQTPFAAATLPAPTMESAG
jgi:hypothetical protein